MTTFDIVGRCFLFLLLSSAGPYFILLAFIPSWRKKGPIHLEIYLGSSRSKDKPMVIAEWNLSEETSAKITPWSAGYSCLVESPASFGRGIYDEAKTKRVSSF